MSRAPHLCHRGSLEAIGFVIDAALSGRAEARRRVLALWEPGATVHRIAAGWLVRLSAPRRVRVDRALGLPLAAAGSLMTAAPLEPKEIERLGAPAGSMVRYARGEIEVVAPRSLEVEDVAGWLALDAFELLEGEPLGEPPARPVPAVMPTAPATRSLFHHAVAKPPPEMKSVLAAVERLREGAAAPTRETRAAESALGATPRGGGWLRSFFGAIAQLLARLAPAPTARPRGSGEPLPSKSRSLAVRDAAPAGPSLLSRWLSRMNDLIARALLRTKLAEYFGRRQAEYLGRMIEMFERGDLDDALRHAIPLGTGSDGASRPALGVPSPRADLAIPAGENRSGSAILLAGGFFADLRTMYRRAFERLEAAGRIDEAAFVLAELLHANEEAVAFLERHERFRLAAEIAEARALPAGLVVRQWFLAGQRDRAVRIARRSGAFQDAVERLERAKSPAAEALRLLWAESLAEAGNYAAAVDVAVKLVAARRLVQAWMDRGIDQGGVPAAMLLARRLDWSAEGFPESRDRCLALLAADHEDAALERSAFARMLAMGTARETHALAAPAVRALVRDVRAGVAPDGALVQRLTSHAGDAALRADVPPHFGVVAAIPAARALGDVVLAAHDAGPTSIFDAVRLPRGRMLLALGEAGVVVIDRDGRRVAHFDQPAHHLVPSDARDRAIAVARRGDAVRLARIDVVGRRSEVWAEALLDTWASDFDGSEWLVARDDQVMRLDATLPRLESLDSIELGDGARVSALARAPTRAAFVARFPGPQGAIRYERWRYDLPSWALRARTDVRGAHALESIAVASDGAVVAVRVREGASGESELVLDLLGDSAQREHVPAPFPVPERVFVEGKWILLDASRDADRCLVVLEHRTLARVGTISFGATRTLSARFEGDLLVTGDARGRVVVADLVRAALVTNLRV